MTFEDYDIRLYVDYDRGSDLNDRVVVEIYSQDGKFIVQIAKNDGEDRVSVEIPKDTVEDMQCRKVDFEYLFQSLKCARKKLMKFDST